PGLQIEGHRLEAPAKAAKLGEIPLAAFRQVISKAPPAAAYVSFASVPPDIEKVLPHVQEQPLLMVFDPWGTTNWVRALRTGQIRRVIVPRPGATAANAAGVTGPPGEIFNQFFLLATPASADEIASQLKTK